jgi:FtsZ-binding cell division protein ZapB
MSKALLDALESKLLAVVETIETLRRELNELKDERRLMEDKLRHLIGRIDQAGATAPGEAARQRVGETAGAGSIPFSPSGVG